MLPFTSSIAFVHVGMFPSIYCSSSRRPEFSLNMGCGLLLLRTTSDKIQDTILCCTTTAATQHTWRSLRPSAAWTESRPHCFTNSTPRLLTAAAAAGVPFRLRCRNATSRRQNCSACAFSLSLDTDLCLHEGQRTRTVLFNYAIIFCPCTTYWKFLD